jgi:hypothetical protein
LLIASRARKILWQRVLGNVFIYECLNTRYIIELILYHIYVISNTSIFKHTLCLFVMTSLIKSRFIRKCTGSFCNFSPHNKVKKLSTLHSLSLSYPLLYNKQCLGTLSMRLLITRIQNLLLGYINPCRFNSSLKENFVHKLSLNHRIYIAIDTAKLGSVLSAIPCKMQTKII